MSIGFSVDESSSLVGLRFHIVLDWQVIRMRMCFSMP